MDEMALVEKGLDFELRRVDVTAFEQMEPGFLALNSSGQAPVLEVGAHLGLGERGLFLDHLLDDALVDAELPQHFFVETGAVGLPVLLDLLLVDPPESRRGDVASVDARDDGVAGSALRRIVQEAGNVEEHKDTTTIARLHLSQLRWRRIRSSIVMGVGILERGKM